MCGGWATHIYLKPGTRIIKLDADAETFMAGGCALPTSLHAIERADIRIGDTVLVLGSGPVGINSIIIALMRGALRVICIGAPQLRLDAAQNTGASATLSIETSDEQQRLDWVLSETGGRGADVTIEATGAPEAVVQAMRFTRDSGTVVVVGQYTDHGTTSFNPHLDLNRKHLDVRGCWGSDFSHFYRGVQIMAEERWADVWRRLKVQSYSLESANAALAEVASGRVLKALIAPTT
jgi:L-iditol 2-dehydrogenase